MRCDLRHKQTIVFVLAYACELTSGRCILRGIKMSEMTLSYWNRKKEKPID